MSNVSVLPDSPDVSSAWLQAAKHLKLQPARSCFNLVYSIDDPATMTDADRATYARFDAFAVQAEIGTTTTVANTIFPLDSYRAFGRPGLYDRYEAEILPQVRVRWGTYFDRMIRRRGVDAKTLHSKTGEPFNPLELMIGKLQARVKDTQRTKNHYEIPIADELFELTTYLPEHDCNYQLGGPCLSHLSFKVDDAGALRLTALYRSHYYVERALGNLLGLARLQAYVAVESGLDIGPLTCIASQARLETSVKNMKVADVSAFLTSCGV